jgi:hypothetical protein
MKGERDLAGLGMVMKERMSAEPPAHEEAASFTGQTALIDGVLTKILTKNSWQAWSRLTFRPEPTGRREDRVPYHLNT